MRHFIALLFLMPSLTVAQTWTHQDADNGALVYGSAVSGAGLGFFCNAPSTGGVDPLTAGAHEDTRTPRDMLGIEIGFDRAAAAVAERFDLVLWVDQTGYRLPPAIRNEMTGVWETFVSTADPMVSDLLDGAEALVLAPGTEQAWSFATDGLPDSLRQTIATCDAAWSAVVALQPSTAPSATPLMARARADIVAGCQGGYSEDGQAVFAGLIDNDAVADVVVWWNNIICSGPMRRPFCGASHCSAQVYLSSRAGAQPEDFLSQSFSLVPLTNGRMGLQLAGRFASCGADSLGCVRVWYWTGSAFAEVP